MCIRDSSKRNRGGKDSQVEVALKLWFLNVREKDDQIDGPLMCQKAEELAKKMGKNYFVATDGWFNRWKRRGNIVLKRAHRNKRENSNFFETEDWVNIKWRSVCSTCDIYNAQETGLFYRALPPHISPIDRDVKGCKTYKERITVLCCVSMSGDKRRLLVIGKTKSPHSFKVVKNLPVEYHANSKTWMSH